MCRIQSYSTRALHMAGHHVNRIIHMFHVLWVSSYTFKHNKIKIAFQFLDCSHTCISQYYSSFDYKVHVTVIFKLFKKACLLKLCINLHSNKVYMYVFQYMYMYYALFHNNQSWIASKVV